MDKEYMYSAARFNLLSALLEVFNHTGPDDTDGIIARHLLEHYDVLEEINIYDMANDCFVSRASIQRFARSIGFESFTDLKRSHAAVSGHLDAARDYAVQPDYASTVVGQMDEMMHDIVQGLQEPAFGEVLRLLHEAENVYVLRAATSHAGTRKFQEDTFLGGKIVRLASDTMGMRDALSRLTERDLVMTVSGTGIFALAIRESLEGIHAHKVLLSMNESHEVAEPYDVVCYVGSHRLNNASIPAHGIRNVYTRYGMPFFLDLMSHEYFARYGEAGRA